MLEKIKLRHMGLNHIKRWNRQLVIRKGVLSPSEKEKYLDNKDGSIVEAKSSNLGGDFFVPQYPNFQPDAYAIEDWIDTDIRNVSGQPEFRRGGSTPLKTRALGELDVINEFASARANERGDLVEEFCESIATKQLKLMQANFDIPQIAPIVDDNLLPDIQAFFKTNGSERFFGNSFQFNKEDLLDDVDIKIKKGSMVPLTRDNQQKILQNLIATVGQALPPPVLSAMVKEFVTSFDMKTIEKAFDDAEAEAKVQRVVQEALANERDTVRKSGVQARQLGIETGASGSEVPTI